MCLFQHPWHAESVMNSRLLEKHVGVPGIFSKLSFIEAVSKEKNDPKNSTYCHTVFFKITTLCLSNFSVCGTRLSYTELLCLGSKKCRNFISLLYWSEIYRLEKIGSFDLYFINWQFLCTLPRIPRVRINSLSLWQLTVWVLEAS